MSQELLKTEKESIVGKEVEYVDRILNEHSESGILPPSADRSPAVMGAGNNSTLDCREPIVAHAADALLHNLRQKDKKVNLVLVATSLDEKDVVEKLKGTLDPTKSSMIPLKFEDGTNGISDKIGAHLGDCTAQGDKSSTSEHDVRRTGSRRVVEQDKHGKYWKRRTSNNEAAKKSRDARKLRFEWIETRTKELEVENASLRQQLQILTEEVLEKEKKLN